MVAVAVLRDDGAVALEAMQHHALGHLGVGWPRDDVDLVAKLPELTGEVEYVDTLTTAVHVPTVGQEAYSHLTLPHDGSSSTEIAIVRFGTRGKPHYRPPCRDVTSLASGRYFRTAAKVSGTKYARGIAGLAVSNQTIQGRN